jgi:DNA-binding response OmpR family regulator
MPTHKPARLLIADDDPELLAAYALYFSAHGFDVRTARNGLGRSEERRESLRSGFNHHFVKPAPMPVILGALTGRRRH